MKKWLILSFLGLSACSDPCVGYGFQPGTEGYANCRMQRSLAWSNAFQNNAASTSSYTQPTHCTSTVSPSNTFSRGQSTGSNVNTSCY